MGITILSLLSSAITTTPKGALVFKGTISVPTDFPTSGAVQNGWTYFVLSDVTDNNPAKTNTGQSFLAGDEIAWNGTNWSSLGAIPLWEDTSVDLRPANDGRNIDLRSGGLKDDNTSALVNLADPSNGTVSTFNRSIIGAINELNYFQDKIRKDISLFINRTADVTLTTAGATDLQTAINGLSDGNILEIQVNATYNPITIPASKRFALRVAEGYDVRISGSQCIVLNDGANNVFISGLILDSSTSGTNSQGSAIAFQHQAIVNNITFHNITFRNNDRSAVVLSYHQNVGGDSYSTANLLSEMSDKVSFIDCHFHKASDEPIEGGAIVMRGINHAFVDNCKFDAQALSRGILFQNSTNVCAIRNIISNGGGAGNGEGIKIDKLGTPTYSNSGYFIDNEVHNCIEGIDIDDTVSAFVINNRVSHCTDEGISLDSSSQGVFIGNISYNNFDGIRAEVGSLINLKFNFAFSNTNQNYRMDNSYSPDDSNSTSIVDSLVSADYIPYDNSSSSLNSNLASTAIDEIDTKFVHMNEPGGIKDISESTVAFSDSSPDRTFTIQPSASQFDFYIQGKYFIKTSAETKQITTAEGLHYIYYDNNGVLQESINPSNTQIDTILRKDAILSIIYWDATNLKHIYFAEERHGIQMDGSTHSQQHFTQGTKFLDGAALNNLLTDQSGALDSHAQFGVDAGKIQDEDLSISNSAVSSTTGLPVYYKLGAAGNWRQEINAGFSVLTIGTGRLAWNQFTGGVWQKTEITNGRYVLIHIYATNDIDYSYFSVLGQAEYINIITARAGANIEINNLNKAGLPYAEYTPIATIIFQTDNAYVNAVKARTRQTDLGTDYVDWRFSDISPAVTSVNHHGNLSGLVNDDHMQYALLVGRSGDILKMDKIDPYTTGSHVTIAKTNIYSDITDKITLVGYNNSKLGTNNTAMGHLAYANGDGSAFSNCSYGYDSLFSCISGNQNAAYGTFSAENMLGSKNCCYGTEAGRLHTTGDGNIYYGHACGRNSGSGTNSTCVGTEAAYNATGSYCVLIGYQSGYDETGDHKLYIANSNTTTPLIYGEFDNKLVKINGIHETIQSNATAAKPAVTIQQDDISEGFINFVGSDRGSIATSTTDSVGSFRIEINGTIYIVPCYTDA